MIFHPFGRYELIYILLATLNWLCEGSHLNKMQEISTIQTTLKL